MNNAVYYHVAYVVAALVYGGYTLSIWWRDRELARREAAARAAAPAGTSARESR